MDSQSIGVLQDGAVLESNSRILEFTGTPGIHGVLDVHSTLERNGATTFLRSGTMVVRTSGYLRMQIGDAVTVDGVRTGWYAFHDDANALVVALSAPIAVTVRGEWTILTAGEQLRVPTDLNLPLQRSLVPQRWLQDYAARMEALSEEVIDLHIVIADDSPLRLLRDAMDAKDYAKALAFVRDATYEHVLSSELHRPAVSAIVAEIGRMRRVDADVIAVALHCVRSISGDMPMDRLLSISYGLGLTPGADEKTESVLADVFTVGDDAVRWAQLLADIEHTSALPLPDVFVTRWQRLLERAVTADPASALSLFSGASALPLLIEDRGFPRHARLWEDAIRQSVAFATPLLSDAERTAVAKALHDAEVRALPKPERVAAKASSSAAPAVSTRVPEELIAMTKQAVLEHGGMLTPTTSFVIPANQADAVRVLGVYFATRKGDLSFEFTYHPISATLDRIVVADQLLPNTLTLEQFLAGL